MKTANKILIVIIITAICGILLFLIFHPCPKYYPAPLYVDLPGAKHSQQLSERLIQLYVGKFCPNSSPVSFLFNIAFAQQGSGTDLFNLKNNHPNLVVAYDKIKIFDAWDFLKLQTISFSTTTIGIIDSGIDSLHPEFFNVNFGKSGPLSLKDRAADEERPAGHGTEVAGIIGANNLQIISVTSSQMNGIISGVTNKYVLESRTKELLTVASFGSILDTLPNDSAVNMSIKAADCRTLSIFCIKGEDFTSATNYFRDGIVSHASDTFIIAAGNDGIDVQNSIPSNINASNTIVVAATELNDNRADFGFLVGSSNSGVGVDLSAPGKKVYAPAIIGKGNFPTSTVEALNYKTDFSGTSAAAPLVTGVAAILKSIKPSLTPGEIKNILTTTADPLFTSDSNELSKTLGSACNPGNRSDFRGCRLNALAAVESLFKSSWLKLSPQNVPLGFHPSKPVYSTSTNRLMTFGGLISSPCCSETTDTLVLTNANGLENNIPTWIKLTPTGTIPPPRIEEANAYDIAHNIMIMMGGGQVGGGAFSTRFNDVWTLTNANGTETASPRWREIFPKGTPPPIREDHQSAYDPNTNRLIVFGGGNNGIMDVPSDVWVLTNANGLDNVSSTWIKLAPAGGHPPRRQQFVSAYDQTTNRFMIFGGCCPDMSDFWILTNANGAENDTPTWINVIPSGTAPGVREADAFGYDLPTNRFFFAGGVNGGRAAVNDVWVLTNANDISGSQTWVNTVPNDFPNAPPRGGVPGVYDPTSRRLMTLPPDGTLHLLQNADSVTPVADPMPPTPFLITPPVDTSNTVSSTGM